MQLKERFKKINKVVGLALWFSAILISILFYQYAYNSGYGYDSIEYLVIGRSILDGYEFYTFIPSKSWGLYYLVAAWLSMFPDPGHHAKTMIVVCLLLTVLVSNYLVVQSLYSRAVAVVSVVFTTTSAMFMEMNYLEPEGLVLLAGLAAYFIVAVDNGNYRSRWFIAGCIIGAGMAFKSVSAFYALGFCVYALVSAIRGASKVESLEKVLSISMGVAVTLLAQFYYFYHTGKLESYYFWSFEFPLLYYPQDTQFIVKVFTKLLWFIVLVSFAIVTSISVSYRRRIWLDRRTLLAFLLGICALLSLTKSQASHYFFPAAGFLGIFVAAVAIEVCDRYRNRIKNISVLLVAGIMTSITASVVLYKPDVLSRFVGLKSYENDNRIQDIANHYVDEHQKVLSMEESGVFYWLSGRYPNYPLVYLNVQAAFWLNENPDSVKSLFGDRNLGLVHLDWNRFEQWARNSMSNDAAGRVLEDLRQELSKGWKLVDTVENGSIWIRTRR